MNPAMTRPSVGLAAAALLLAACSDGGSASIGDPPSPTASSEAAPGSLAFDDLLALSAGVEQVAAWGLRPGRRALRGAEWTGDRR